MPNLDKIRSDTPGVNKVCHFNNAGAALPPKTVLETVTSYLEEEALYGGYETASARSEGRKRIYKTIATFIGTEPRNIALMESATDAWQRAFYSIPLQKGDRILTSRMEYGANAIAYLQQCRKTGAELEIVETDKHGIIDLDALVAQLDDDVSVVSITHMPTNSGAVQPVEKIGQLVREHAPNTWYIVDACQSVGQYPIEVGDIQCDVLTATGRKYLRGPRGTGFLYASPRFLDDTAIEPAMLDHFGAHWDQTYFYTLRDDARRFERWEANWGLRLGLAEAVSYANQVGMDWISQQIAHKATQLRNGLTQLPHITICDPMGDNTLSGIITFTVKGYTAVEIRKQLAEQGINVSVSTAGSALWDMEARSLHQVVRASVHYYNSASEIKKLISCLETLQN